MIASNNRFLRRVNPEITRALADSGSSLEHSEIQQLMRQMVDLNIADNLKLWVHSGLVKTRTSGSDTFVPKAYDISGEENDAAQATEANQPKLVSDGMEFDTSALLAPSANTVIQTTHSFSVGMWLKSNTSSGATSNAIMFSGSSGMVLGMYIRRLNEAIELRYMDDSTNYSLNFIPSNINTNIFYYCLFTWNISTGKLTIYLNGGFVDDSTPSNITSISSTQIRIGGRHVGAIQDQYWDGIINDIRIYNKALSAAQITAIYNQTKGFYGIT